MASSAPDIDTLRLDFCSMILRAKGATVAHFVAWLDLKVAEYKVYGHMILTNEEGDNQPGFQTDDPSHWPGIVSGDCSSPQVETEADQSEGDNTDSAISTLKTEPELDVSAMDSQMFVSTVEDVKPDIRSLESVRGLFSGHTGQLPHSFPAQPTQPHISLPQNNVSLPVPSTSHSFPGPGRGGGFPRARGSRVGPLMRGGVPRPGAVVRGRGQAKRVSFPARSSSAVSTAIQATSVSPSLLPRRLNVDADPLKVPAVMPADNTCTHCGKHCQTAFDLALHMQSHQVPVVKFICPICEKAFPSKSALKQHQISHVSKNLCPHFCRFCNKQFRRRHHLTRHELQHTRKGELEPSQIM